MTTAADIIRPTHAAPAPRSIGQGTAIEQSRAIAQVQAMVVVAQQCPRRVHACLSAMEEACQQIELAEKAFFRYPRAGETISGPSVHLARELARCWGNVEHGVTELRRDDHAAESEMQAFAWDLEANTRSASIFIVPHKRDTKKGVRELTDMRDIYENNANNGARRLREAIFSVLPAWFTARAIAMCEQTLAGGGGKPLAARISDAVKAFERYGVTPGRMEAKFGRPVAQWTGHDVALLGTIYQSIQQGTVTADEEFPAGERVTAAEILGERPPAAPEPGRGKRQRTAPPPDGDDRPPARTTSGQVGMIQTEWKRLGYEPHERDERLAFTARLARVEELASTKDLTQDQAAGVLSALKTFASRAEVVEYLFGSGDAPGGSDG